MAKVKKVSMVPEESEEGEERSSMGGKYPAQYVEQIHSVSGK